MTSMPASDQPEITVIRRAQRGDVPAYETLYQRHRSRVYLRCLQMIGNTSDAEDLTQEVFLRLYLGLPTFRGGAQLSTWLYRVTTNCVLMHLRKLRGVDMPIDSLLESETFSLVADLPMCFFPSPLHGVAIKRALHTLSAKQQDVFLLHDVGGFTHREIAECLGLTVSNSKCRLRRAHLEMRDSLWTRSMR
jgi:RNA polymerase sigma-70 factor (ECF subfamily)